MIDLTKRLFRNGALLAAATVSLMLVSGGQPAYAHPTTASPQTITPTMVCGNPPTSTQSCAYFQINVGDTWDQGTYTGPYLDGYVALIGGNEIEIHLQSDTQKIKDTTYEYKFGDLFLNFTGYSGTGITLTASNWISVGGLYDSNGNNNTNYVFGQQPNGGGPFGAFNRGADDQDGFNAAVTSLDFIVTASGANSSNFWTDARNVLDNNGINGAGYSAEAHIYTAIASNPYLTDIKTTGYAGYHKMPEPGPLALLGFGLIGLTVIRQRYRKS